MAGLMVSSDRTTAEEGRVAPSKGRQQWETTEAAEKDEFATQKWDKAGEGWEKGRGRRRTRRVMSCFSFNGASEISGRSLLQSPKLLLSSIVNLPLSGSDVAANLHTHSVWTSTYSATL